MKAYAIILALCLAGCSTTIYGPDGKPQFRTFADLSDVVVTTPGSTFQASRVSHSAPTRAAANGVTQAITASGAAFITGGAK